MAFSSNSGGLSTRGRGGSVGARDPEEKSLEVQRVQDIHAQQHGGRESGVKKTCEIRNGSLRQPDQDTVWGKPQR